MAAEKTTALIIRGVDFSETSRIVTFLTRDFGKAAALAKGGRRLKSSFEVALDLLSVCSICLIRKPSAELDLLTEASLVERFTGLRQNLSALYAGYYIAEVLDSMVQKGEPHPLLFDRAVDSLRHLSEGEPHFVSLARFLLILVRELGYSPNLDQCVGCGESASHSGRVRYSVISGGILCERCSPSQLGVEWVSEDVIVAMRNLGLETEAEITPLLGSANVVRELWRLMSGKINAMLGRKPRSLAFLQS